MPIDRHRSSPRPALASRARAFPRACRLASIAILALPLLFAAPRASAAPPGVRWAVLVGSDGAADEAQRELANLLVKEYGYRPEHVSVRPPPEAARAVILDLLRELTARVGPADTLLVVFSLPTIESDGKGDTFLVPVDGNPREPWTLLAHRELLGLLQSVPARATLAIAPRCADEGGLDPRASFMAEQTRGRARAPSVMTFCPPRVAGAAAPARAGGAPALHGDTGAELMRALLAALAASASDDKPLTLSRLLDSVRQHYRAGVLDLSYLRGYAADPRDEFEFVRSTARLASLLPDLSRAAPPDEKVRTMNRLVDTIRGTGAVDASQVRQVRDGLMGLISSATEATSVRLAAVRAIGRLDAPDAVADLTRLSQPPFDEGIRHTAVEALAALGRPETLAPMLAALRDPAASVRITATRALARSVPTNAPLMGLLNDASAGVRVAALQSLSERANLSQADRRVIRKRLTDTSPEVRREAVTTLARIGEDLATPEILPLLDTDPDDTVRQTVAYSLGRTYKPATRGTGGPASSDDPSKGDTRIVSWLVRASAPPQPEKVRAGALWSLGEIGGAQAERRLLAVLVEPSSALQSAAAEALGRLRSRKAVPELIRLLNDKSPGLRATAASALGAIGEATGAKPLLAMVKDEDSFVRQTAERALSKLQPVGPADIRATIADPSARVRVEAVAQIARLGDPALVPLLFKALNDDALDVRRHALSALARGRIAAVDGWLQNSAITFMVSKITPEWTKAVAAGVEDDNLLVRIASATALRALEKVEAVPALLTRVAKETNPSARVEMLRALGASGPGRADVEVVLLKAAADPDPMMRQAAAYGLGGFESAAADEARRRLALDDVTDVRDAAFGSLRAVASASGKK